MKLSITEAKARFAEAIKAAENGETIEITRHGKVVAVVSAPIPAKAPIRRLGELEGQIWMADDFDELGPEWDEYMLDR